MSRATDPAHYDRLSPQDASFLAFESANVFMHIGAVTIFDSTSFALPSGDVDLPKFRRYIESRLKLVPRTRQRLAENPITRQPVWIDDDLFDISHHVRELRLPSPGDEGKLKRAASTVFSGSLERSRPLWEMHVVQGLSPSGQFAVIAKAHHAMLDGVAGVDFARIMLSQDACDEIESVEPFRARPAPSRWRLARDEVRRYGAAPIGLSRGIAAFLRSGAVRKSFADHVWALTTFMASGLRGTPQGPLTGASSTERVVDWFVCDRADERSIRARLGGTRDDVTLAVASGAAREVVRNAGGDLTNRVRAMAPVNLRSRRDANRLGNRVSMLIVDLPLDVPSPAARLAQISERTGRLIQAKHQLGVDTLAKIDVWTGTLAQTFAMWLSRRVRAYNFVITNIPGPPLPLYALRSRLLAFYPVAPVFPDQHFNVAALPYLGKVYWGVNYGGHDADEQRRFMRDLESSFKELRAAAAHALPRVKLVEPKQSALDGLGDRRSARA